MKKNILFILFFTNSVFANQHENKKMTDLNNVKSESIKDSAAEFWVNIRDVDEPVFEPLVMNILVKCNDRRKNPNQVKPKMEVILGDFKACEFLGVDQDREKNKATIKFKVSEPNSKTGEAECLQEYSQEFDLDKICEAWK